MLQQSNEYIVRCNSCEYPDNIIHLIPINPHGVTIMEVVIYNDGILYKEYACPKCGQVHIETFFEDSHREGLSLEDIY